MSSDQQPHPRRVLLVDDDATQLKLGRLRLTAAGFEVETASGADEALQKAKRRAPDAILSDVLMGDLDGFGLCRLIREERSLDAVPVILLSAHYQGEPDQELATRVGASALISRTPDFDIELETLRRSLEGGRLPRMVKSDVELYEQHLRTNASQISKLLGQAKSAEERYRTLFQSASDTITVLDENGIILEANDRWLDVLGIPAEQIVGRHIEEFAAPGHASASTDEYGRLIERDSGRAEGVPLKRPDGRTIYMDFAASMVEIDGHPIVLSIGRDVTEKVLAAERLAAAEHKYRSLIERIPDVIWISTLDGTLTFITQNIEKLLGYTAEEICTEDFDRRTQAVHPDDRTAMLEAYRVFSELGQRFDLEYRCRHRDGHWVWIRNRSIATYKRDGATYLEGMLSDVTDRKRLEESFRQSQKMEAIGQLTGGIAHDFNNILAAILANSHFLIEDLADHDPRRVDAEEIKAAAERAASLTRQLLAFSRRQMLEPTIVDLNASVAGVEKMLRRLIGEDIDFEVIAASDLGSVKVDVGQLEQVIMNLVVNARDAMPKGGKLSLETANVEFAGDYSDSHDVTPGSYVMLAVADNGSGMDAETRRRIFEPFFTTKEVGKGTGLGLSTCYGIVKQSGGYIWVYSEPNHGTVFKIYLPRVDARPDAARKGTGTIDLSGHETILVIEDDVRVRAAVSRMLEPRGYRLLLASNGAEAVELAERHHGAIHLVLSDMIMPGASGPEVVARLEESRTIRALFMSGYTDHAILRSEALHAGMNFIQKPFTPETLAKKVREVLDSPKS